MSQPREYVQRDAGEGRLVAIEERLAIEEDAIERGLLLLERASLLKGSARLQDALAAYQAAPTLSQVPLAILRALADQSAHQGIEKVLRAELRLEIDSARSERSRRLLIAAILGRILPAGSLDEARAALAELPDDATKAALKERIARELGDDELLTEALIEREAMSADPKRAAIFRLERLSTQAAACATSDQYERALEMARASETLGEPLHAALYYLRAASASAGDPNAQDAAFLAASRAAPESAFVQSLALSESASAQGEIEARLNLLDPGDPVDQLSEGFALIQAGKIKRARLLLERAYERSASLEALLLLDRALELSGDHRARVSLLESHLEERATRDEKASLLLLLAAILEDELNDEEGASAKLIEAALGDSPSLPAIARTLAQRMGSSDQSPRLPIVQKLFQQLAEAYPASELMAALVIEGALSGSLDPSLQGAMERSPLLGEIARYLALRSGDLEGAEGALLKLGETSEQLSAPTKIAAAALAVARGSGERALGILNSIRSSGASSRASVRSPLSVALEESIRGTKRESGGARARTLADDPLREAIEAELRAEDELALERYLEAGDAPLAIDGLRRLAFAARSRHRISALKNIAREGASGTSAKNAALLELALSGDREATTRLDPAESGHALELLLGGPLEGDQALTAITTLSRAQPDRPIALPRAIFGDGAAFSSLLSAPDLSPADRERAQWISAALGELSLEPEAAREGESALGRAFERERALSSNDPRARAEALTALATDPSGRIDVELLSESGWAALEAGDHERALAAARRLVVLEPDDLSSLELLRVAAIGAREYALASSASLSLAEYARGRRAHVLMNEAVELYLLSEGSTDRAAALFEQCVQRSALTQRTLRALSRRAESLDAAAQRERLIRLLGALPTDHPLHEACLLELAFLDRDRGSLRESYRWIKQIDISPTALVKAPIEALELRAELAIIEKRSDEAIWILRECVKRREEPAARAPLLGWLAQLLEARGDHTEAIAIYSDLRAIRPLTVIELETLSHLAIQVGDHDAAIAANLEAAAKTRPTEAAALHLRAAKIAREARGGRELAKRFYRGAIREDSATIDAVIGLHQLSANPAEQRRIEARIAELIDQRFPLERVEIAFIRSVVDYARAIGNPIRAAAATEALSAIGAILPDSFDESDEYTQVVLHDEHDPGAILLALSEQAPLEETIAALSIVDGSLERGDRAEALGFTLSDRIRRESASPLRDELNALGKLFGEEELDLFRGGSDAEAIFFGRLKRTSAFFAGADARAPLSRAARFAIGAELYSHRRGSSALLSVDLEDLEVFAADLHRAAKGEATQGAALSQLAPGFLERRSLRAALERCGSAEDLSASLRALRAEHDRASLLAVGDLHETLRLILGGAPDRQRVEASARGLALYSFFIDKRADRFHRFYGAGQ